MPRVIAWAPQMTQEGNVELVAHYDDRYPWRYAFLHKGLAERYANWMRLGPTVARRKRLFQLEARPTND
jgi:hypothetical protein